MASPVYSTLFISNNVGGEATYDVPAGYVAVLRDVDLTYAGEAENVTVYVVCNGVIVFLAELGAASSTPAWTGWRGRQVIPAGSNQIEVTVIGGTVGVSISGYLLTLP